METFYFEGLKTSRILGRITSFLFTVALVTASVFHGGLIVGCATSDNLRSVTPVTRDEEAGMYLRKDRLRFTPTARDEEALVLEIGESGGVEMLIDALQDADPVVRVTAAKMLVQTGDAAAVGPLIGALSDEEPYVRKQAIRALARLKDTRAVEPLISSLGDEHPRVRIDAAWALGEMKDPRAVDPLLTVLRDKTSSIRVTAARALGKIGSPQVLEPLIAILREADEDPFLRGAAAWALGVGGGRNAVGHLIAALDDENQIVVKEAAAALGNIGDPQAAKPLVDSLDKNQSASLEVKTEITGAIGKIGTPAVGPLIECLETKNFYLLGAVVWMLGELRDARAVEPLIPVFLEARSYRITEEAARALIKIGSPAIDPLISILFDESYSDSQLLGYSQWNVANTLKQMNNPDVGKRLMAVMAKRGPSVRLINTLGRFRDKRAGTHLISALQNKDPLIRESAARVLGEIGDTRAVEPLIAALKDENAKVRNKAAGALGSIGDTRAVDPLLTSLASLANRDPVGRKSVIKALGDIGDSEVAEHLIVISRDRDSEIRRVVAEALGEICDSQAIDTLISLLKDPFPQVRKAAAQSLGRMGDRRAVGPLIDLLMWDWYSAETAAETLGKLGDPRAVKPLITSFGDVEPVSGDLSVRAKIDKIAQALVNIGDARAVKPLTSFMKNDDRERFHFLKRLGMEIRNPQMAKDIITVLAAEKKKKIYSDRTNLYEVIREFIGSLAKSAPPATDLLINLLKEENPLFRSKAAESLGKIKDPRAVKPLISLLMDDKEYWVRASAAEALGEIGNGRAVEPLIAALDDSSDKVRWKAAEVLGKMAEAGDDKAADYLIKAFEKGRPRMIIPGGYRFFIRKGIPASEPVLIREVFLATGAWDHKRAAEDFLNSGNSLLEEAGREYIYKRCWLEKYHPSGEKGPRWGEGLREEDYETGP